LWHGLIQGCLEHQPQAGLWHPSSCAGAQGMPALFKSPFGSDCYKFWQ
jgi:hypothetical protein